ncbi:MAG: hypothetical protein HZB68_01175 [Candidatus Aenigmarchaeota archaeon]|nr:hypothetical protein [Candidatus Aenigmarchaeota archaeon]
MKAVFAIAFLLLISQVYGTESKAGDLIATMDIQPSDVHSGKLEIISFSFRGLNNDVVTHIDGYVDILKDNVTIVKDYYLHTHNDDFSMLHTFASPGTYKVVVSVKPSEHYKGWEFAPANASFEIIVKEQKAEEQKGNNYGIIIIVAGLAIVVSLIAKSILKK